MRVDWLHLGGGHSPYLVDVGVIYRNTRIHDAPVGTRCEKSESLIYRADTNLCAMLDGIRWTKRMFERGCQWHDNWIEIGSIKIDHYRISTVDPDGYANTGRNGNILEWKGSLYHPSCFRTEYPDAWKELNDLLTVISELKGPAYGPEVFSK